MKNTELFDFQFVDREKERNISKKFFSDKSENTLWIKGASGYGKTTFFKYVFANYSGHSLCYLDIKANSNSITIISDFIEELQKESKVDFLDVLKDKYKKFYNGIYKETKNITSTVFPNISKVVSILFDASYIAITYENKHKDSLDVLVEYIQTILKDKQLCVCIDNFSRCDLETANMFFRIFKSFMFEEHFYSCIITTSEDLQLELQEAIQRNLPFTEIKITELNRYTYFCQILKPIFDMDEFTSEDIEYLYQKCKGSPKKLSTVISKLLENNGIQIRPMAKAKIDKRTLFAILQEEHIRFKDEDFNAIQKWIIFSYLCMSVKTHVQQVENMALFISQKIFLFRAYNQKTFEAELPELINNKILNYDCDEMISPCHDGDYRELMDIWQESQMKRIFSQAAYEFFLSQEDFPEKWELLCRHAREAEVPGWERLNFLYGKSLAHNNQIYDAQKIFTYLDGRIDKLHVMQLLFMAINSYRTGNYNHSIRQMNVISPEKLRFGKARYYFYFYIGKNYNNIGAVAKGAEMLEKALKEVTLNSREYIQTLNILHMYYYEMPEKSDLSLKYFNEIKDNYETLYPDIWANTMRGCHNFLDNKQALNVLDKAEKMLVDELEKAYIKTTKGFVLIKENKIVDARHSFEEACETIKRLKIHEYSYAANNLALCYMLEKSYQEAQDILTESILWNRTEYGNNVLQVHLMICAIYLKHWEEAKEYYDHLVTYISEKKPKDPIINRKIYMNLAIASKAFNNSIMENSFLKKAEAYVKGSSSEWRFLVLTQQVDQGHCIRPKETYKSFTDFDPWFLVYAHD